MTTTVLSRIENDVAWITLNRPDKRNALNRLLVEELKQVIQTINQNRQVKVVVITGVGKAFCAGADLEYLQEISQYDDKQNLADSFSLAELFRNIYHLPQITIAMVNGPAIAGGCGLATVCDFIFAARESAFFGYTEARIGFVPALVANFLIRKISPGKARELLLTGEVMNAQRALEIGLVNRVFPAAELQQHTEIFINELLSQNSYQALQQTKELLVAIQEMSLEEGMDYAARINVKARKMPDCQKGLRAFLEKKKLDWRKVPLFRKVHLL